jgi:hypothetical protein
MAETSRIIDEGSSGESSLNYKSQLRSAVWNPEVTAAQVSSEHARYYDVILEQYKIYVEMADRVSARRGVANSFFLTVNLAIVGLLGPVIATGSIGMKKWLLTVITVTLLGQCAAWLSLIRSYRILNKAKFEVIGILEERLPACVYSRGEWTSSVRANRLGRYFGLTKVEQTMPVLFAFTYVAIFISLVV